MMRHCAFNELIYLFDLDVNSLIARYPDNLSRFFHALTSFFSENLLKKAACNCVNQTFHTGLTRRSRYNYYKG